MAIKASYTWATKPIVLKRVQRPRATPPQVAVSIARGEGGRAPRFYFSGSLSIRAQPKENTVVQGKSGVEQVENHLKLLDRFGIAEDGQNVHDC